MQMVVRTISQRSKGILLCSAPTALSAMDYSIQSIDDGVVDSPPPKVRKRVVCSPSPLRKTIRSHSPSVAVDIKAQRNLYGTSPFQANGVSNEVQLVKVVCTYSMAVSIYIAGIDLFVVCAVIAVSYKCPR